MPASPDDVLSFVMFARVVEAKSFTAAASKVGVSKSVVSARIAQLERRLGTRLLQRTTRRLSLTADGLALYEHAARIASEADQAAALAAGSAPEPRGTVRVSVPVAFSQLKLTAAIGTYLARYPSARVELLLSDRLVDLVGEGIDVAIRMSAGLRDSSLVGRKLAEGHTVVCASPDYLARMGTPSVPSDLLQHHCVHYSLLKTTDEWRFRDGGRSYGVPVTARVESASGLVVLEAALAGIGIAVLPSFVVSDHLAAGRLQQVLASFTFIKLAMHAIYPSAGVVPTNVRALVDLFAAHMKRLT